jgi:hypothetical protein
MTPFIILTSEQAASVRGSSEYVPGAGLNPIERAGGLYILGVEVLADPAHSAHRDYLAALPQMGSTDPGFPAEVE